MFREKDLKEELELLSQNSNLGKEYYRQKYNLEMSRRRKAKRVFFMLLLQTSIYVILAIGMDLHMMTPLNPVPIFTLMLGSAVVIIDLFLWLNFIRKYQSSEAKFSKYLKLKLAKQYNSQKEPQS